MAGASRQPIRVTDLADAVAVLELIGVLLRYDSFGFNGGTAWLRVRASEG